MINFEKMFVYNFLRFISIKKTIKINVTFAHGRETPNKVIGVSNINERKNKNLYFFNHIVFC